MSEPLRSEILAPTSYLSAALLAAAGCGALAAAAMLAFGGETARETTRHEIVVDVPATEVTQPTVRVAPPPPVMPAAGSDLALAFEAGGAHFVQLARRGVELDVMPPHGAPRLAEDDAITSAIAPVAESDLPAAYQGWIGKQVVVDGTCSDHVTGFAVVSRLVGKPDYAPIENGQGDWTVEQVLEHGSVSLAAVLAGSCTGTIARDADLPPAVHPIAVDDDALAARARAALVRSQVSRRIHEQNVAEFGPGKPWHTSRYAEFTAKVVRHPVTGTTWVWAQGRLDDGCGAPGANVFALYRVAGDGTLNAVHERALDDPFLQISDVVDVDGDGALELVGSGLSETIVTHADGEVLDELAMPFYGCHC